MTAEGAATLVSLGAVRWLRALLKSENIFPWVKLMTHEPELNLVAYGQVMMEGLRLYGIK